MHDRHVLIDSEVVIQQESSYPTPKHCDLLMDASLVFQDQDQDSDDSVWFPGYPLLTGRQLSHETNKKTMWSRTKSHESSWLVTWDPYIGLFKIIPM